MKNTRYQQLQKKIPRVKNNELWNLEEIHNWQYPFLINLFLNLHTVNLRAWIENNTKDNIGWRLFIFYGRYMVINLAGYWIV